MSNQIKIHTEGTPNPNALKFVLDKNIIDNGSANFTDKSKSKDSPLAEKLFTIQPVEEVFLGKNFITISKNSNTNWDEIYDKIIDTINKHFESGEPVLLKIKTKGETHWNEVEQKIHDILDNHIRPAVASDGGDVIFDSFKDGILRLHLQGSCSSCPSSVMTLKSGIESMLKKAIPELKEVISV